MSAVQTLAAPLYAAKRLETAFTLTRAEDYISAHARLQLMTDAKKLAGL